MRVSSISLRDFRNYAEADITIEQGCVVLVGSNGQGKTNLIEAINFLATLGSHRSSTESAMIRTGEDAAIIRVHLAHDDRQILLEAQLNREGPNKAQFNRSTARLRDFPRYIATVLFAPEDLLLIRGDPASRRRFLDELIVTRTPRLSSILSDYERALKQRNTLLKTARFSEASVGKLSTLDIWDDRLATLGSEIMVERQRLVRDLAGPVAAAYESIAGADHHPELLMKESVLLPLGDSTIDQTTQAFLAVLNSNRATEVERGMTLYGPHRDDVEFSLNSLPTKGYASHGETWSFALSLRLGAARLLRAESVLGDPILILDDVFAELDASRRERLASAVSDFEQIFITAAVVEDVPAALLQHVFRVERGTIARALK
ncbi:DNA replication/repair protein RecF [Alpinimonas psychrophila]|uniref:DNA replication and repair protein RecF n=1 Tax=Alpinimonas psychrophila TaxID=748908 RepID=A0A7W3JU61_9MICO|nr:DNA replication/repair protein RecF [Alpinimonas psychrophila]MBA8829331.1 DNA replication and repair protein RecF [Alpinimonas psychrophila]